MFIINNRWSTQKPPVGTQIDWGHPLAKGLVGCWVMNEGVGNKLQDLTNRNNGTLNSDAYFSITEKGRAVYFDGSDDYVQIKNGTILSGYDKYSLTSWIKATRTSGNRAIQGERSSSGNWIIKTNLEINNAGPLGTWPLGLTEGALDLVLRDDNEASLKIICTNEAIDDGKFHFVSGVRNGQIVDLYWSMGSNLKKLKGTSIGTTGFSTSSTPSYRIGGDIADAVGNFGGYIHYNLIHNRALTTDEIEWLFYEPYCFLKPIVRRFYSISGQAPTETRLLQKIIIPSNSKIGIRDGVKMVWRY